MGQALAAERRALSNGRVTAAARPPDDPLVCDHRAGRPAVARPGPRGPVRAAPPAPAGRHQAAPGGGAALADIQAELAGATDASLRRIAAVPPALLDPGPVVPTGLLDLDPTPDPAVTTALRDVDAAAPATTDQTGPGSELTGTGGKILTPRAGSRFWTDRPSAAPAEATSTRDEPMSTGDETVHGVRLGQAILLLPVRPDADDLAAIRAAAQPLLDLLAHRGLLAQPGGSAS